ncbi:MAG: hypothetical protein U1E83_04840 [Methylotetracoccus sp.]
MHAPGGYTDTVAEKSGVEAVSLQSRNIPILITGESGSGKEHLVRPLPCRWLSQSRAFDRNQLRLDLTGRVNGWL